MKALANLRHTNKHIHATMEMQPKIPDKACPISDDVVTPESMAATKEAMIVDCDNNLFAVHFGFDTR